jgi:hypothetical protein
VTQQEWPQKFSLKRESEAVSVLEFASLTSDWGQQGLDELDKLESPNEEG